MPCGRMRGHRHAPVDELENYTSAGALALAFDIPIEVVPNDLINLKITYRNDMEAFKKERDVPIMIANAPGIIFGLVTAITALL